MNVTIKGSSGQGSQGMNLASTSNTGSAFLLSGSSIYINHPATVDISVDLTLKSSENVAVYVYLQLNGSNVKSVYFQYNNAAIATNPRSMTYAFEANSGDRISFLYNGGNSNRSSASGSATLSGVVRS